MWRPGRRLFTVACILILLTAAAHTVGFASAKSSGPEEDTAIAAMKNFHNELGMGMSPSTYDIFMGLAYAMTITFVSLGMLGLMLASSRSVSSAVIRRVTWFYVLWVAAFVALNYYYRVPPPLISGAAIEVALVLALVLPSKNEPEIADKV